jgi:hypothetical protein
VLEISSNASYELRRYRGNKGERREDQVRQGGKRNEDDSRLTMYSQILEFPT